IFDYANQSFKKIGIGYLTYCCRSICGRIEPRRLQYFADEQTIFSKCTIDQCKHRRRYKSGLEQSSHISPALLNSIIAIYPDFSSEYRFASSKENNNSVCQTFGVEPLLPLKQSDCR